MKFIVLLSLAFVFSQFTNAQSNMVASYIDSTNVYLGKKEFDKAYYYSIKALSFDDTPDPNLLYSCGVLAAKNGKTDLGFEFVNQAVRAGFNNYKYASSNEEFPLVKDNRWNECLKKIRKNDSIANLLTLRLDSIFKKDQALRMEWQELELSGVTEDDPKMQRIESNMIKIDSIHLNTIDELINEYGYYGRSLRTIGAQNAIFLIVQHCNDIVKQEKFFLIFREAAKRGEFHKSNLAYLEDRILLRKTGKQKYGTQYEIVGKKVKFFPFIDELKTDEYRRDLGLDSLESYRERVEKSFQ